MVTMITSIFVFGILIFVHEFGHFLLAKKNGVRVEKFSFGFGPRLWGKKIGDTEYLISAVPLGGYIKMAGDEPSKEVTGASWEYLSRSCGQRAQIVAAGPILNYLLAFFLFTFIFIIGSPTLTTRVGELLEDFPAKAAGIQKDDIVLTVDGEEVKYWPEMSELIHQKTEGKITLDIKRDDDIFQIQLRPKIEEREDIFKQKIKIALVGIYPSEEMVEIKYGWGESFYQGTKKLINLTGITYKALWYVSTLRLSFKESMAGPILIFQITGNAARMGFIHVLSLMGLLSMSLAIFNFLPLPVLDGGHLLFLLLEKLRKRPISAKTQEVATQLGMLFLITIMIFVSYNDLMRVGIFEKVADWWQSLVPKK